MKRCTLGAARRFCCHVASALAATAGRRSASSHVLRVLRRDEHHCVQPLTGAIQCHRLALLESVHDCEQAPTRTTPICLVSGATVFWTVGVACMPICMPRAGAQRVSCVLSRCMAAGSAILPSSQRFFPRSGSQKGVQLLWENRFLEVQVGDPAAPLDCDRF